MVVVPARTMMTCAARGSRAKTRLLHERVLAGHSCGSAGERDRDAARVILAVRAWDPPDPPRGSDHPSSSRERTSSLVMVRPEEKTGSPVPRLTLTLLGP